MPTIHVNQIDIHYEIKGAGEPLLFLHGLGSSGRDWEKQIPFFADRYQVITCDLRGHGSSSKPPGPYSVEQFATDVAALLSGLGIAPAHVVGISMGGMVAFQLVLDFPERVKSLTIVNSYPEMRVETWYERRQVWRRFLVIDLLGMRKVGQVLSKRLFIKPEQGELRSLFASRWAENDKRSYREALRAIIGWDVEDRLGEIHCPVLVVASDEDYLPLDEKKAYKAKIPGAKLVVVEDARHAVTVEKPEQFNHLLGEFLANIQA